MNIGFDDPDVLLHYEQLKVQDLEKALGDKIDKLKVVEKDFAEIKDQVEKQTKAASKAKEEKEAASRELVEAVDSKASLAQKCALEIMRLTMILNTLQSHPKLKSLVQTLLEESTNNTKYVGPGYYHFPSCFVRWDGSRWLVLRSPINLEHPRRSIFLKEQYFGGNEL